MRAPAVVLAFALLPVRVWAEEPSRPADVTPWEDKVRPVLVSHCYGCHSQDAREVKGDFRLDRLSTDFAGEAVRERWLAVRKRIEAGEMPPKSKPRLPEKEARLLTDWIGAQVESAEAARRGRGRVVLRRLNRIEYENTVRDLLGVPIDLKESLPPDTAAHGFDNVGEALHVSSFLMERYLEAADRALGQAIANGPRPPLIKKRYSLKNQHHVKTATENVFRKLDDTVVLFSSSAWHAVHLYEFYPPHRGNYRVRISASGFQSAGKPVTYRVDAGLMGMVGKNHLVGYFDAPADRPAVVEFVDHLEAHSTIRILPYGLAAAQAVHKIGADKYDGPGLAVQWVDVEGPLHDTWPPPSHRRLLGDLAREPVGGNRDRLEVASKNPEADAARILREFARRAYRRAVTDDDVRPLLDLTMRKLAQGRTFEQAVRVGLLAAMVSPEFLFLHEKPGKLDDFALASRLSYFLWSTMPDEELLALAERKKLGEPDVLRRQVERLLADPKAKALTENFAGQWLGLRDIDFTEPSHILYPEFDDMLKASMLKETYLFFDEVLRNDLSLTNFVASDFAMLNGRLAKHYGIPLTPNPSPPGGRGEKEKAPLPSGERGEQKAPLPSGERGWGEGGGWEFKKVKLPADSHRGGVLTMASVLKVTANGTTTSPVVRGAWVLDRILGAPPSPPPPGVSAVDPDTRGATTIREQLAKHRQVPSCAVCHTKIDPPGFALESFDVIGGWREHYRSTGNGKPVTVDGRRMPYLQGPKVDPADVLSDGRKFKDIDEFKQLLLKDRDRLARALAVKLLTYATGGAPSSGDKTDIEDIVRKVRDRDYGFRTLVHEIVQSKAFQSK